MATTATRKRSVASASQVAKIPTAITKLAVLYWKAKTKMNKHKRTSDKARKELYGFLKGEDIQSFDIETNVDGKPVTLDVAISTGNPRTKIDAKALVELYEDKKITRDQFIESIATSVTAVNAACGKAITSQVSVVCEGSENVDVKPST